MRPGKIKPYTLKFGILLFRLRQRSLICTAEGAEPRGQDLELQDLAKPHICKLSFSLSFRMYICCKEEAARKLEAKTSFLSLSKRSFSLQDEEKELLAAHEWDVKRSANPKLDRAC